MKIVMINGQNHKGSSYHIGRLLAEQLAGNAEITEFFLPRDLHHFCVGCYQCLEADEKCPYYAEKKVISDAIAAAAVLIFTTPTYCLRASAPMKAFIDLTFTNWLSHRPKAYMFQKKAVVVSTAAGAGTRSAIKDVTTSLKYWGISYIKTLGFAVQAIDWESVAENRKRKIEKKAAKLATKVGKDAVRVRLRTKFLFQMMKMNVRNSGEENSPLRTDYLYWKNNGWFDGERPY